MTADLDRLEAAARAARPEVNRNWRYRRSPEGPPYGYVEWGKRHRGLGTATLSEPLARYIAELSPATVLALIARLRRLEAEAARHWEHEFQPPECHPCAALRLDAEQP